MTNTTNKGIAIDPDVRSLIDGGWRQWDAIDRDLANGSIDEEGWYRAVQSVLVPLYLAAPTPQQQSGHSGDALTWKEGRGFIVDAIDGSGALLDVGCANGYLMETVTEWSAERGFAIETFGLDISVDLVALAKSRLPQWADRFWVGNALYWTPPFRFDFVHLQSLDYVPVHRRRRLVEHLVADVCVPSGRLIIGPTNEFVATKTTETALLKWGFRITGQRERRHSHPQVVRRMFWVDAS